MKRALSLLLAASLSLSLVACGKPNDSGTSGSGSGSKAPTELSATQTIIQEAQGMTLEELAKKAIEETNGKTFYGVGNSSRGSLLAYKKQPGVAVDEAAYNECVNMKEAIAHACSLL